MNRIELTNPSTIDSMKLVEVPCPEPGPAEVLVRVRASSLNFHDYLVATGIMQAAAGRVPLSDGAGEVVAVGRDVKTLKAGDRVMGTFFPEWLDGPPVASKVTVMRGEHVDGYASEYVLNLERDLVKMPAAMSFEEAATLPCAGLTAWRALVVEGQVKPGDTVLVEGTGGVSTFALQFAKMAGARVIALTSSGEKKARLEALGADHVLNYRDQPEWAPVVKELTRGWGTDHVVEVVGGELVQTIRACRVGGCIHMVGALSRKPIQFPAGLVINGNTRLTGLTVGSRTHLEQLVSAVDANGLSPVIDKVFPLSELAHAFRRQESKLQVGKICVSI
jgi:NADPH:quinone reductase-like Zn-dependent oxidoreductase